MLPGYLFVDLVGRARIPWVPRPVYAPPAAGYLQRHRLLHLEAIRRMDSRVVQNVANKLRGFEVRPTTKAVELSVAAEWPGEPTAPRTDGYSMNDNMATAAAAAATSTAGAYQRWWGLRQCGVTRTNCVDCLDRTNSGQEQLGMYALSVMLKALDYGPSGTQSKQPTVPERGSYPATRRSVDGYLSEEQTRLRKGLWAERLQQTEVALNLAIMYEEMGDRIALQYGGSEAHHKISRRDRLGLKAGRVSSGAKESLELVESTAARQIQEDRDSAAAATSAEEELALGSRSRISVLTSIQRYYSNSFTDAFKQDSINVFLGKYRPRNGAKHLWELSSDRVLHNNDSSMLGAELMLASPDHGAPGGQASRAPGERTLGSALLEFATDWTRSGRRVREGGAESTSRFDRLIPSQWVPPSGLGNFWSEPVKAFYERSLRLQDVDCASISTRDDAIL